MCVAHLTLNRLAAMRRWDGFRELHTELYADFKLNDNQMRGVASELMHNTVLLTLDASGAALTWEGCCSQRCESCAQ